ncbi:hypothetical protein [Streptomyces sp. NPDC093970]|uniref:hypothetical protein n=1 Tax=Streptomyces sp. NPDC093970 TaxID=3155076 RepID=UPI00343A3619
MPENTAHATELASQYLSQVTGDLEHNIKEQDRITAELAVLQDQLVTLQQNHTVLVNMRQALGVPAEDRKPADAESAEAATVPSPRKKTASATANAPATGRRRPAKRAAARPSEAGKQAGKPAGPTLVELIHQQVVEQSEPRSAAEIAEAVRTAHTDRTIDTKVVRTTLENLVARSRVHRSKQGSSVFYTAADAPEQEAAATDEAQAESAG